jgi:hypothetical protein
MLDPIEQPKLELRSSGGRHDRIDGDNMHHHNRLRDFFSGIITLPVKRALFTNPSLVFQGNTIHNCADKFLLADLDNLSLLRLFNFPLLLLLDIVPMILVGSL